jgi:uncharacterized protein with PQ loop repeat
MTYVQLHRARTVGVDGISPLTWALFLAMGIFWVAYGIQQRSACMVAGTAMVAPVQAGVLWSIGWRAAWRSMVASLGVVAVTILLPTALFGWNVGAASIGVVMVATRVPQIVDLVTAPSVEGVSVMSWSLSSVNLGLWLYYYLVHHDSGAALSMVATIATNLVITGLTMRRHAHVRAVLARWRGATQRVVGR